MNPPRQMLITPMNVSIKILAYNPIKIPKIPVLKNIAKRTLSFFGGTYLMTFCFPNELIKN